LPTSTQKLGFPEKMQKSAVVGVTFCPFDLLVQKSAVVGDFFTLQPKIFALVKMASSYNWNFFAFLLEIHS